MSANIKSAFERVLLLQSRTVTYYRNSTDTEASLKVAPSNYFRNMDVIDTVSEGREFVLAKQAFEDAGFTGEPERGDRIIDSVMGNFSIQESRHMVILGEIVGYRIRAD
jgi:hypothetical protein